MGIPQVSDRIKEAPAHALRAVFSGFGQLLLAAERLRHQADNAAAGTGPGPAPAAGTARPATMQATAATATPAEAKPAEAKPAAAAGPPAERRRSLDLTGNVRILSPDDPAEDPAPSSAAPVPPAPTPAPPAPVAADPAGTTVAEAAPAAAPSEASTSHQPEAPAADQPEAAAAPDAPEPAGTAVAALPVPGYDGLSLPSLRARLRTLDAGQLRVLIAYEHEHAGRADVLAMFERRIAKLAGE